MKKAAKKKAPPKKVAKKSVAKKKVPKKTGKKRVAKGKPVKKSEDFTITYDWRFPDSERVEAEVCENLGRDVVRTQFGSGINGYRIQVDGGWIELKRRRNGTFYVTFKPGKWLSDLIESLNAKADTKQRPKKKKKIVGDPVPDFLPRFPLDFQEKTTAKKRPSSSKKLPEWPPKDLDSEGEIEDDD